MTKTNLKAGMMVVTADGKARVVLPTKADGLVLMAEDNKALKVSKLADDLTNGSYRADKTVMQVYDVMENVNGHIFDDSNRFLLFDRESGVDKDTDYYADDCDDDNDDDENWDNDDDECCDCEDCTCGEFTKANVTPGMLAVTRDGQNRLAIPTADMGLVLATPDSKFVRLDKLNDDLTIRDYRNANKNVDKVYGVASGVTTDFYSEANRPLLFDRDAE